MYACCYPQQEFHDTRIMLKLLLAVLEILRAYHYKYYQHLHDPADFRRTDNPYLMCSNMMISNRRTNLRLLMSWSLRAKKGLHAWLAHDITTQVPYFSQMSWKILFSKWKLLRFKENLNPIVIPRLFANMAEAGPEVSSDITSSETAVPNSNGVMADDGGIDSNSAPLTPSIYPVLNPTAPPQPTVTSVPEDVTLRENQVRRDADRNSAHKKLQRLGTAPLANSYICSATQS